MVCNFHVPYIINFLSQEIPDSQFWKQKIVCLGGIRQLPIAGAAESRAWIIKCILNVVSYDFVCMLALLALHNLL